MDFERKQEKFTCFTLRLLLEMYGSWDETVKVYQNKDNKLQSKMARLTRTKESGVRIWRFVFAISCRFAWESIRLIWFRLTEFPFLRTDNKMKNPIETFPLEKSEHFFDCCLLNEWTSKKTHINTVFYGMCVYAIDKTEKEIVYAHELQTPNICVDKGK